MNAQQFDLLDGEIVSLQATITMWRTLPDEVESIREEFALASQKQKELDQQVQLKQLDIDELSESGIASTMLNILGKRKEMLGYEKARLQELQEAALAHQQELDSLFQELAEAESQLTQFRNAEEKLAQDKAQQLELILGLPETEAQIALKQCLVQVETCQAEHIQLGKMEELGERLREQFVAFLLEYDRVFVLFRDETGAMLKIAESLNTWEQMFAQAQRPFWAGHVTPFAYLPLGTKIASADNPQRNSWSSYINRLYRFVRTHVEKLQADQINKQDELVQLAKKQESLISQLWQRDQLVDSE